MNLHLENSIEQAINAIAFLKKPNSLRFMQDVAQAISHCFLQGNKIIIAGNGGSLCDASHFAEELTGFFRGYRPALPAISLSEPGHITCTGNDIGFDWVFSRGVEAYGKPGDIFVGLTTSGNSTNIINAFESAKKLGLSTVSFLGKGGGKLKGVADFELSIDGFSTSDRIQEAHMAAIHMIIEEVERILYPSSEPLKAKQPALV